MEFDQTSPSSAPPEPNATTVGAGGVTPGTMHRSLVDLIDAELERFGRRDLVSGSEVVDTLLDLRLAVLAEDAELQKLIDSERTPAGAA